MNGNKNIIEIVSDLVSLMTPFVTVTSIVASGDLWRLNTCNTYWITLNSSIIINEVEYIIKGIVQDSYIEIESSTEPTVTEFQLLAPEFWHSSSRKVSGERSQKTDVRKPFVYLPVPRVTEDKVYDSDKAYDAEIKPIFLTNFDPQTDTIGLQQEYIIEPLNAMANFFVYLIEDDLVNFDDLATIDRKEWMNFGDEVVWGSDKKIFKENLSGVELSFTLPVFQNESCDCSVVSKVCADASVYINDVFYTFVESGGTVNIITGVCDPATVNLNGVFNQTVASGGTANVIVENSEITVNGAAFDSLVPEEALNVIVEYANGTPTGTNVGGIITIDNPIIANNSASLFKTGANVSYQAQDDGALQFGNGVDFFTLNANNPFGNLNRLTDSLGTQIYANGIVIDWLTWNVGGATVRGYYNTLNASDTLTNQLDNQPYTRASFTGWYVCNYVELTNIFNLGITRDFMNYAPFNHSIGASTTRVWVSTRDSATFGIFYSGLSIGIGNHTGSYQALLTREFTLTELGL